MTIRDLLCHRGGLGTWAGDMLQFSSYPLEEIVRRLRYIPPAIAFEQGMDIAISCSLLPNLSSPQ